MRQLQITPGQGGGLGKGTKKGTKGLLYLLSTLVTSNQALTTETHGVFDRE